MATYAVPSDDENRQRLKELETELEAVRQERDEAREIARELYHHPDRHRELWYRWLKEEK